MRLFEWKERLWLELPENESFYTHRILKRPRPSRPLTLDDMIGSTEGGVEHRLRLSPTWSPTWISLPKPRFIIMRTSADRFLYLSMGDGPMASPIRCMISYPATSVASGCGGASDMIPFNKQLSWLGSKAAHKACAQLHYPQMVKIVSISLSWHALSKIPSPCSLLVAPSFDVVLANGCAKLDHFNVRFSFESNQQIVLIKISSSSSYF